MSDATQALHKIARGTGIIFAGTVISMLSDGLPKRKTYE